MYRIARDISGYLFRDYDIRGANPDFARRQKAKPGTLLSKSAYCARLGVNDAYTIGLAFARYLTPKRVVVGGDMRKTTPRLKAALIRGMLDSGVHVDDIGLASTPLLYFSNAHMGYDAGIEVTASHSIPELNGFKMHDHNSLPIAKGTGIEELKRTALRGDFSQGTKKGELRAVQVLPGYARYIRSLVDTRRIKGLRVVMDAGNGMGGYVAKEVFSGIDMDIVQMYFEPDGGFPHHLPNPSIAENNAMLARRIPKEKADFGVAFDGDADRVVFFDDKGERIPSDFITCLLAQWSLLRHPKGRIIYTAPMSWAIPEQVSMLGGRPIMARVGNASCKIALREHRAVFAGEAAGHFMFKETYNSENAMLPILIIAEMMARRRKPLKELVDEVSGGLRMSGDINMETSDSRKLIRKLKALYGKARKVYELDGLSVEYDDWHFNVRPSANDPVVRLNVEARDGKMLEEKTLELREAIRRFEEVD